MARLDRVLLIGARAQGIIVPLGLTGFVVGVATGGSLATVVGVVAISGGVTLQLLLPPPSRRSRTIGPPVVGCWLAVNSPASRVPSHGTNAYGQTFAVDLLHDPERTGVPTTGWWPLTRPPSTFPALRVSVGCEGGEEAGSAASTACVLT